MATLQTVRGTHDMLPEESALYRLLTSQAQRVAAIYGFEEIRTPIFEFAEVFRHMGATSDVVTKETYTFTDRGGQELTLRPEGTASIVRAIISNSLAQEAPLKYFYYGPMFRYERPQKGRQRQFHQIGVELLGVADPVADVEVIALAAHILKALKVDKNVKLLINTLGDLESRQAYREALYNYLVPYKNDLSPDSQMRLERNPLRILDSKDSKDQKLLEAAPRCQDYWTSPAKAFFEQVLQGLDSLGIAYQIDDKLVRGLDYYCHTTFEFITDKLGTQSAVLAGGRYDGLAKEMGGSDMAGIGWATGVERLMHLTQLQPPKDRPIALILLGEQAEAAGLSLLQHLRHAEIRTELCYTGNLGKKMKKANKMGAKWALIMGDSEVAAQQVMMRDLDSGEQTAISTSDIINHIYNLKSAQQP